jgi:son of sevenless-like protein
MTPGTVPVGLRSEGVPAPPRLAPVNESISSDMSNETDTADEVVLVPRNPRPEKVRNLTGDDNAFKFVETKTTPSTPSWYLKAQYAEEELKIEFDGSIKLGTLRALVEQLTGEFTSE